jgi:hypothetical protein
LSGRLGLVLPSVGEGFFALFCNGTTSGVGQRISSGIDGSSISPNKTVPHTRHPLHRAVANNQPDDPIAIREILGVRNSGRDGRLIRNATEPSVINEGRTVCRDAEHVGGRSVEGDDVASEKVITSPVHPVYARGRSVGEGRGGSNVGERHTVIQVDCDRNGGLGVGGVVVVATTRRGVRATAKSRRKNRAHHYHAHQVGFHKPSS